MVRKNGTIEMVISWSYHQLSEIPDTCPWWPWQLGQKAVRPTTP
jgi:hypothetical protein